MKKYMAFLMLFSHMFLNGTEVDPVVEGLRAENSRLSSELARLRSSYNGHRKMLQAASFIKWDEDHKQGQIDAVDTLYREHEPVPYNSKNDWIKFSIGGTFLGLFASILPESPEFKIGIFGIAAVSVLGIGKCIIGHRAAFPACFEAKKLVWGTAKAGANDLEVAAAILYNQGFVVRNVEKGLLRKTETA